MSKNRLIIMCSAKGNFVHFITLLAILPMNGFPTDQLASIDYSHGTSAHAQKGRGLLEEVLKMCNCGTVCQFGSIFHTKSDTF